MLDKKIKRKWVTALMSGKFKKGIGALTSTTSKKTSRFCCLGVLCEISHRIKRKGDNYLFGKQPRHLDLPDTFLREIGLSLEEQNILIILNDDKRWSLKKIGKYIEKNL